MERRVLFVIFSCFLVLYLWNAFVIKPTQRSPKSPVSTATETAPDSGAASTTTSAAPAIPQPTAAPVLGTAVIAESTERDVRVETRDVIAVFTNRGGRLKSWRLKHYLDQAREPQELVENGAATQPLPFTLRTGTDTIDSTLNTALYAVS